MRRRRFLELAGVACGALALPGCARGPESPPPGAGALPEAPLLPEELRGKVFVARGTDPAASLEAAVDAAGGLVFVPKGGTVVIKPNAAWARTPEQAATTDPALVAAMVRLCLKGRAGRVVVFEHTIDRPAAQVLAMTGIGRAASEAGADVIAGSSESDYIPLEVPRGRLMKRDTVARIVRDANVFINMPKAKQHSATELTLGLKNLMGINWNRQAWHTGPDLHQYIADYATAIPLHLTVVDATRILLTNGPKGPGETADPREVIVSRDPVAADAYASTLFGRRPADVGYIAKAQELGLGVGDKAALQVTRV